MKITGEKAEIEKIYKILSENFSKMRKSRITPIHSGNYKCYIITDTEPIETSQHK